MDMGLSKLQELVMDREAWRAAIHGVIKSRTRLSNWTELNPPPGSFQGQLQEQVLMLEDRRRRGPCLWEQGDLPAVGRP